MYKYINIKYSICYTKINIFFFSCVFSSFIHLLDRVSLVPQAVSCSELLPLPVAQHLGATGLCPHQLLSKGTSLWGKNIAFRQLLQNIKYLIIYKIIKYLVYFQKLNLIKLDSFLQVLLTFIVIHEVLNVQQ